MKTARYLNPNIDVQRHVPIRISLGIPKFRLPYAIAGYAGLLAPMRAMLGVTDRPTYESLYRKLLDRLGVERIHRALRTLHTPPDREIVLLCFEDVRDPDAFCHRRIFADWWQLRTGREVLELDEPAPKPRGKPLFE
jgi:hypothetical protein